MNRNRVKNKIRNPAGTALLAVVLLALAAGPSSAQTKVKDLAPQFKDWLNLTAYIILPAEKEVFLALSNDIERAAFIEAFWKQRDPTPATPQNEYKDEILKRFSYVNEYFRRGTSRPGWMTDMGRIYMILGPPTNIEHFENAYNIYPTQVWYYYGDATKGLPTSFAIIFAQIRGGEFRLYNPVSDGPESLIMNTQGIDLTNHETVYEKIRESAPTLASISLSLIPGQIPYNYVPSPQSNMVLSSVFESPQKDVSPAYATHFLNYKGMVSTEYLTNYVESAAELAVIRDPVLGLDFLHFSIAPRNLSLDYYEQGNQYYCNFKLSVSLRKGEDVVFQYSKDYPFYLPPDKVDNVRANGVSVLDLFPIAAGKYGLTILLQNTVGKEFSLFEKDVTVPAADGPARLAEPVLGYKLQDAPTAANVPFKLLDKQLSTDPKATLGLGDDVAYAIEVLGVSQDLWSRGEVEVAVEGAAAPGKPARTFALKLAEQPFHPAIDLTGAFPARELVPDYYEMKISLKDGGGNVMDTATLPFIVSRESAVPHPVTLVRALPAANSFLYFYGLAIQCDKSGDPAGAEAAYRKAVELKPDYPEGLSDFADFLVRAGKYDQALQVVEPLQNLDKFRFNYFLIRGRALMGKGDYEPALQSLLEGNRIYNSDTRLLNALGFCFYKTGRKKEAQDALAASLRLNPDQPDVKALAATIEKELRRP
jgi:GWxTD domain-containing protein